jgi:hypothetical protein
MEAPGSAGRLGRPQVEHGAIHPAPPPARMAGPSCFPGGGARRATAYCRSSQSASAAAKCGLGSGRTSRRGSAQLRGWPSRVRGVRPGRRRVGLRRTSSRRRDQACWSLARARWRREGRWTRRRAWRSCCLRASAFSGPGGISRRPAGVASQGNFGRTGLDRPHIDFAGWEIEWRCNPLSQAGPGSTGRSTTWRRGNCPLRRPAAAAAPASRKGVGAALCRQSAKFPQATARRDGDRFLPRVGSQAGEFRPGAATCSRQFRLGADGPPDLPHPS